MKTYLGTYFFQKAFVEYFGLWENYDDGPVMYQNLILSPFSTITRNLIQLLQCELHIRN